MAALFLLRFLLAMPCFRYLMAPTMLAAEAPVAGCELRAGATGPKHGASAQPRLGAQTARVALCALPVRCCLAQVWHHNL